MMEKQAFTLIEMVVVCLIIGVLMAIGIPSYYRSAETAKCKEAMQTLNTISSGAFAFYAENNTFTGISVPVINTQSGVNIVNNADWTYSAAATGGGIGFTITGTRLKGPHQAAGNTVISLDQNHVWAGPYPRDNPGNF